MATILIIDDDDAFRDGLAETVRDLGHMPLEARSGEQAFERVHGQAPPDCIFLDFRLPDRDGLAVLEALRSTASLQHVPVVMLTGYATSDNTIGAMRLGAFEHLTKPVGRDEIAALLARILATRADGPAPQATRTFAHETPSHEPQLLGISEAMRDVQKRLGRAAGTNSTVLITGETGTGKEVAARVLHRASPRASGPFVAVNCAAIPADLLESELFGHGKGAFTGAHTERRGRFEEAHGGTLFLDEVGDMPLAMQAKLLRVLQERQITPLGTNRTVAVDVRVVAATHRDLPAMVAAGTFRQDLVYRLNVIPLHMPPLRERVADILPLAEHFLASVTGPSGTAGKHLSADAQRLLVSFTWPGNVRELANAIERANALAPAALLTREDFAFLFDQGGGCAAAIPASFIDLPLNDALAQLERALIARALALAGGNRAEAARRLGISRQSLYTRLAHFGLSDADPGA
ncbi:sigma-54-dependent transcriptional regulator [Paraburkholderia silvatlantica]|uniref:DNA-binding NtrC family response regulator n=1 Tax=Paraburkholderia silvatlantica TaxID=321895 RepID=A0A2U1A8F7_9BURK|nr:sigma-54 dependent transcriptional regulator [Paraburkholderia silvatlantica]MBB2929038.1 DNA-binding NtrC family response regulator [Paraburkholderia silvatlantica]PVY29133.1 DNA-binding NtrC family response regulator [Paraburkholderia silvatlantica]PXW36608.1 DNA-binding NtrC family response regulator [Paraburkholderia silvatlantica]PYE22092.1 DNA-binding NtrC family response regulator [Paraburkholderia silvatlantica]TDQ98996.1 DNA-binding NtrC family response regulator [Paraburkholderia 